MTGGSLGWWAARLRQARRHLTASVAPAERADLEAWLSPAQLGLFDAMHVADRRHGLDVVAWLRADGVDDPDVLVAGLLHDAGKGRTGFVPRVVHSLAQAYGGWIVRAAGVWPPLRASLRRLATHAETSAGLAVAAGCSERTVELIREQEENVPEDRLAQRLHLADEAS